MASQLLLGRPHKADTFCLTAALPRPQHGRTSTTKRLQTLSAASVSLPRCFPHCRALAPLEGQTHSHTLWGQGAPWRPPGSISRLLRTQAGLKSIRRGCCLSHQTRYSFILGWYSGGFFQSLPNWKCLGTLVISYLESPASLGALPDSCPYLKSFLLSFPKTTSPHFRQASLSSHSFTPNTE